MKTIRTIIVALLMGIALIWGLSKTVYYVEKDDLKYWPDGYTELVEKRSSRAYIPSFARAPEAYKIEKLVLADMPNNDSSASVRFLNSKTAVVYASYRIGSSCWVSFTYVVVKKYWKWVIIRKYRRCIYLS